MAMVNIQDWSILGRGSTSQSLCPWEWQSQKWCYQSFESCLLNRGVIVVRASSRNSACGPPRTATLQKTVLEEIVVRPRGDVASNSMRFPDALEGTARHEDSAELELRDDVQMASRAALQDEEQEPHSQQNNSSPGSTPSSKRYSVSRGRRIQSVAGYTSMIVMYTRTKRFKEAGEMISEMDFHKLVPDKSNWVARISAFAQQGRVRQTQRTLKGMQESGISPNLEVFNSLIFLYGKARMYSQAHATFTKMSDSGVDPNQSTFRSMIGACGRSGKLKDAVKFFEEMRKRRLCPSLENFSTLVNLYGRARSVGGVVQTIQVMKDLGCRPTAQIVDACLRAMERAGRLSNNLEKLLSSLKDAGWDADGASLSPILDAYLKCGMMPEALKAFRSMRHMNLVPKEGLCRELMSQCKYARRVKDVEYVYNELESAGVTPSHETTCTMISAFGLVGKVKEAENLYMKLRTSGMKLDIVVYNVMIDVYLRGGSYQEAARVFETVERQPGVCPDVCTFFGMFRVHQKGQLEQGAVDLYWKLLSAGIKLDENMTNCIINCCGRTLPVEETSKLFREMLDSGFSPSAVTFNVMIDIYGRAGLLDRAFEVFMTSKEHGMADSITYSTLINYYGRRRDFVSMENVAAEMQTVGLGRWTEAYNAMIDAYGKVGQFGQMEEVLRQMHGAGCCPDIRTFNILINVYGKKGLTREFHRILGEMEEEGKKPDVWTYNTLIGIYGHAENPDQVMRTFKEMQDAGIAPDRITYSNLVAALEKSGNLWEAARWSLWMMQTGFSTEKRSVKG